MTELGSKEACFTSVNVGARCRPQRNTAVLGTFVASVPAPRYSVSTGTVCAVACQPTGDRSGG